MPHFTCTRLFPFDLDAILLQHSLFGFWSHFHTTQEETFLLCHYRYQLGIKKETEQNYYYKVDFFIFYKLDYKLQQSSKMDLKIC
jgi:hypothetical protein